MRKRKANIAHFIYVGITSHGVLPNSYHFMEEQNIMIIITTLEDEVKAILHLSLPIVIIFMELTRWFTYIHTINK